MKLVYADLFSPFTLECDRVNLISIEHGTLYYKLMNEFSAQCGGHDGGFVLSDNNTVLNMSKVTDLVTDYIPFDSNPKRLITRLYSKLEEICAGELFDRTMKFRAALSDYLSSACSMLESDTEYDVQTELKALFKCCELRFSCSSDRLSDKLINYFINSYELDGRRLFVTVGLLNFLSQEEAELFFQTVTSHKLTLLMFENISDYSGGLVNRMTIDRDFCVF